MTNNEGTFICYPSSQSHTQFTEHLNPSKLTMIISAEFSFKKEWDNKSKLIAWVKNSRAMSLESTVDSIKTDLLWNKVSSQMEESDFSSLQVHLDIEPKELDKEREDQLEDVLSETTLRLFQSQLLRKDKNKFRDSLIQSHQEDLVQKELVTSENYMVFKNKKDKMHQSQQHWSKRISLEELSKVKKIQMDIKDTKPQKSKD